MAEPQGHLAGRQRDQSWDDLAPEAGLFGMLTRSWLWRHRPWPWPDADSVLPPALSNSLAFVLLALELPVVRFLVVKTNNHSHSYTETHTHTHTVKLFLLADKPISNWCAEVINTNTNNNKDDSLNVYFNVTERYIVKFLELKVNENFQYTTIYIKNKYWSFLEAGISI